MEEIYLAERYAITATRTESAFKSFTGALEPFDGFAVSSKSSREVTCQSILTSAPPNVRV